MNKYVSSILGSLLFLGMSPWAQALQLNCSTRYDRINPEENWYISSDSNGYLRIQLTKVEGGDVYTGSETYRYL